MKLYNKIKAKILQKQREWHLPASFIRLGTKCGGWWVDAQAIGENPLLIDCGLGLDISFPVQFLQRFGGQVVGIDANPQSIEYCIQRKPTGMQVVHKVFWSKAHEKISFYLPRPREQLPKSSDMISGSVVPFHANVGDRQIELETTSLEEILNATGRSYCDVLKIDIEGAEYPILEHLCISGTIHRIKQLLVEFHHRYVENGTLQTTLDAIQMLKNQGLRLTHQEGPNYIFCHE